MDGLVFFIISLLCGLYLAFMLATGGTLQLNLKMQRITRKSSPFFFELIVIITAIIMAGTLLLSLFLLVKSAFYNDV